MIKLIEIKQANQDIYPLNISALKIIDSLKIDRSIVIFTGDNGTGKSTLLKAIAQKHGAINTGYYPLDSPYYDEIKPLSEAIKLTYDIKHKKGFMFSGEEFITFIHKIQEEKKDLEAYIKEVEVNYKDKSDFARNQALAPARKELHAIMNQYEGELQHKSHGEGFLSFFKSRLHQKGIYFLDEPETPLSPEHQFQLFVLISDLAASGSQIFIATHSPILMALNHAVIYDFNQHLKEVEYDQIESVQFLKYFLNHPHLFKDKVKGHSNE
jgi:predicted ATPase